MCSISAKNENQKISCKCTFNWSQSPLKNNPLPKEDWLWENGVTCLGWAVYAANVSETLNQLRYISVPTNKVLDMFCNSCWRWDNEDHIVASEVKTGNSFHMAGLSQRVTMLCYLQKLAGITMPIFTDRMGLGRTPPCSTFSPRAAFNPVTAWTDVRRTKHRSH